MNDAISKAQYTLKAKIQVFFFSKMNVCILLLCYIFIDSLHTFFLVYAPTAFVFYKLFFGTTKMDNPYKVFLLKMFSDFIENTRKQKYHKRDFKK